MRTLRAKKVKRVHGLHFAPDGSRLLVAGGWEVRGVDSFVWLDLATGENAGRVENLADNYAVDPGLTRLVLIGVNRWGRGGAAPLMWTPLSGPVEWKRLAAPGGSMVGAAFDAAGSRLAFSVQRTFRAGPDDGRRYVHELVLMPLADGAAPVRFEAQFSGRVLALNAAGTRLALTGGVDWDPTAEVYDLAAGKRVFRFVPPATVSRSVLFTPDDRLVVANGRYVYVLPAEGGEPLFTLAGHPKQVNAVALTPDGRRILTASHDGSIRTWDAATGEAGPAFDFGIGPVTAVAFAPDGLTCAAAGLNGKVVVWDVDE